ncbi:ATP-binding cassette domain-containing protein [Noviherbaspirillum cavernae]|uniref:ATP-binding cassette domain-containing protein n=1 Tax=Noviherbaspirillum cavernae TaxID=2320862 RepID=A0A418WWX4_9BURK|nr:ATP-binding cassette domain-containing protein [Noviherbaspirillum cavernae]RJG04712.1 ATP-binding cassette domain-containing protein [Noviherbaspirillum cavernae]
MSMTLHDAGDLLQLEAATARLGDKSFGPFDIRVAPGERIAILGPSGAGKSTLLKLMTRELDCARGRMVLDGKPLQQWPLAQLSRRRAVLPQSNNVAFGLLSELVIGLGRVARTHDRHGAEIVAQAAQMAHAGHLLARRFDTLSGGEQARVQLARVFAQLWDAEGGLVLVDEPLAALDPGLQFELLESMDDYATQRGHAVIAILHDINHALLGFDRLLLIKDGALTGDLRANALALPALEALYGICLNSATNEHGELIVTPGRRTPRASARSALHA